jgi:hypothetical protein
MTTATLESANDTLRDAVARRMAATPADDPKMQGYVAAQRDYRTNPMTPQEVEDTLDEMDQTTAALRSLRGDSLLKSDVHPTSQAFFDLCDALKEMHRKKSRDYGCPSGEDPLANIRNGARFVGIPSWKGAMVRLSDKVTRLAAYNATGRLENESLEDNLFDLASYSLLALLLHREEQGR